MTSSCWQGVLSGPFRCLVASHKHFVASAAFLHCVLSVLPHSLSIELFAPTIDLGSNLMSWFDKVGQPKPDSLEHWIALLQKPTQLVSPKSQKPLNPRKHDGRTRREREQQERRGEDRIAPLSNNLQFYYGRWNTKWLPQKAVPEQPTSMEIRAALPLTPALRNRVGLLELRKKASNHLLVSRWFSSPWGGSWDLVWVSLQAEEWWWTAATMLGVSADHGADPLTSFCFSHNLQTGKRLMI